MKGKGDIMALLRTFLDTLEISHPRSTHLAYYGVWGLTLCGANEKAHLSALLKDAQNCPWHKFVYAMLLAFQTVPHADFHLDQFTTFEVWFLHPCGDITLQAIIDRYLRVVRNAFPGISLLEMDRFRLIYNGLYLALPSPLRHQVDKLSAMTQTEQAYGQTDRSLNQLQTIPRNLYAPDGSIISSDDSVFLNNPTNLFPSCVSIRTEFSIHTLSGLIKLLNAIFARDINSLEKYSVSHSQRVPPIPIERVPSLYEHNSGKGPILVPDGHVLVLPPTSRTRDSSDNRGSDRHADRHADRHTDRHSSRHADRSGRSSSSSARTDSHTQRDTRGRDRRPLRTERTSSSSSQSIASCTFHGNVGHDDAHCMHQHPELYVRRATDARSDTRSKASDASSSARSHQTNKTTTPPTASSQTGSNSNMRPSLSAVRAQDASSTSNTTTHRPRAKSPHPRGQNRPSSIITRSASASSRDSSRSRYDSSSRDTSRSTSRAPSSRTTSPRSPRDRDHSRSSAPQRGQSPNRDNSGRGRHGRQTSKRGGARFAVHHRPLCAEIGVPTIRQQLLLHARMHNVNSDTSDAASYHPGGDSTPRSTHADDSGADNHSPPAQFGVRTDSGYEPTSIRLNNMSSPTRSEYAATSHTASVRLATGSRAQGGHSSSRFMVTHTPCSSTSMMSTDSRNSVIAPAPLLEPSYPFTGGPAVVTSVMIRPESDEKFIGTNPNSLDSLPRDIPLGPEQGQFATAPELNFPIDADHNRVSVTLDESAQQTGHLVMYYSARTVSPLSSSGPTAASADVIYTSCIPPCEEVVSSHGERTPEPPAAPGLQSASEQRYPCPVADDSISSCVPPSEEATVPLIGQRTPEPSASTTDQCTSPQRYPCVTGSRIYTPAAHPKNMTGPATNLAPHRSSSSSTFSQPFSTLSQYFSNSSQPMSTSSRPFSTSTHSPFRPAPSHTSSRVIGRTRPLRAPAHSEPAGDMPHLVFPLHYIDDVVPLTAPLSATHTATAHRYHTL